MLNVELVDYSTISARGFTRVTGPDRQIHIRFWKLFSANDTTDKMSGPMYSIVINNLASVNFNDN